MSDYTTDANGYVIAEEKYDALREAVDEALVAANDELKGDVSAWLEDHIEQFNDDARSIIGDTSQMTEDELDDYVESRFGRDAYVGHDGKVHSKLERAKEEWDSVAVGDLVGQYQVYIDHSDELEGCEAGLESLQWYSENAQFTGQDIELLLDDGLDGVLLPEEIEAIKSGYWRISDRGIESLRVNLY